MTGEFPAQSSSNAENVSIWWRHRDDAAYTAYQWLLHCRLWSIPTDNFMCDLCVPQHPLEEHYSSSDHHENIYKSITWHYENTSLLHYTTFFDSRYTGNVLLQLIISYLLSHGWIRFADCTTDANGPQFNLLTRKKTYSLPREIWGYICKRNAFHYVDTTAGSCCAFHTLGFNNYTSLPYKKLWTLAFTIWHCSIYHVYSLYLDMQCRRLDHRFDIMPYTPALYFHKNDQ